MTEMNSLNAPGISVSAPVDHRLKVTFQSSLPMGYRGTFTYNDELWIAYPAKRNQKVWAVVDRLIGIHGAIIDEMVRWINARPQDADLVARVLERTTRATQMHAELITEKMEATGP